jgi:hypothetical protein
MKSFLPLLLATATASAQSLVYDNGPIVNQSGNLSMLQGSVTATPPAPAAGFHTVFGFGMSNAANLTVADDFTVGAPVVIEQVELFYYQTGASSATPTATGVFLEILNASPSLGGTPVANSPGFANNLFTTNLVSHAFTGVFRVSDTSQAATNRPIMSVKVSLPTPVALPAGSYWLQWSTTGSLASGPWCPPIATLDQGVTGNSLQRTTAAGAFAPLLSGTAPNAYNQGLPFKLYGSGVAAGGIVQTATACGFTGIKVEGAPNVGGYLRTTLSNVLGAGVIGYGFNNSPVVLCGCTIAHSWDVTVVGTSSALQIPSAASLCGFTLGVQGLDYGTAGNCLVFSLTNGYQVTLNN